MDKLIFPPQPNNKFLPWEVTVYLPLTKLKVYKRRKSPLTFTYFYMYYFAIQIHVFLCASALLRFCFFLKAKISKVSELPNNGIVADFSAIQVLQNGQMTGPQGNQGKNESISNANHSKKGYREGGRGFPFFAHTNSRP